MDKQCTRLLELGKRRAERRVGALINEVSVLSASFPHLADAFDADKLPVSFILKRDSRGAKIEVVGRHRSAWAAGTTRLTRRIKKDGKSRRRID
jgi:hypothetical protein